MKQIAYCLVAVCLFSACLSKHDVLQKPQVDNRSTTAKKKHVKKKKRPRSEARHTPARPSTSGLEYVAQYKDIAATEMERYGIPASIKLAQGLLESGNGNSRLAREANNHFGIKCTPDWPGGKTYQDDDRRNDCFRVYERAEDSFTDHSQFLLRKRYSALFKLDRNDYKGWARGLKAAGYATNPRYADLLINLIERYNLQQYDHLKKQYARQEGKQENKKTHQEDTVVHAEIAEEKVDPPAVNQPEMPIAKAPVRIEIHEVKQGETLAWIAERYKMTADELMDLNGLRTESVFLGQLILVSK